MCGSNHARFSRAETKYFVGATEIPRNQIREVSQVEYARLFPHRRDGYTLKSGAKREKVDDRAFWSDMKLREMYEDEARRMSDPPKWMNKDFVQKKMHEIASAGGVAAWVNDQIKNWGTQIGGAKFLVAAGSTPQAIDRVVKWERKEKQTMCGAKCRGARGPACDCICEGQFHGVSVGMSRARFAAEDLDLRPTAEMAANAERGLALREEHGKGGTAVGVARARDIKNRANLSPDTVKRMHSFFSRHEGNQKGGEDDAGYIAWLLWGGDAGKAWSERKAAQIDKDTNMKNARKAGFALDDIGSRERLKESLKRHQFYIDRIRRAQAEFRVAFREDFGINADPEVIRDLNAVVDRAIADSQRNPKKAAADLRAWADGITSMWMHHDHGKRTALAARQIAMQMANLASSGFARKAAQIDKDTNMKNARTGEFAVSKAAQPWWKPLKTGYWVDVYRGDTHIAYGPLVYLTASKGVVSVGSSWNAPNNEVTILPTDRIEVVRKASPAEAKAAGIRLYNARKATPNKDRFSMDMQSKLMDLTRRFGFKPSRVIVRGTHGTILFEDQPGEATRYKQKLAPVMKAMGIPDSAIKAREVSYPEEDGEPATHTGVVEIDYAVLANVKASRSGAKAAFGTPNTVTVKTMLAGPGGSSGVFKVVGYDENGKEFEYGMFAMRSMAEEKARWVARVMDRVYKSSRRGAKAAFGNGETNRRLLQVLGTADYRIAQQVVKNIASHYGINDVAVYEELFSPDAEHLMDYLTEPVRSAAAVILKRKGIMSRPGAKSAFAHPSWHEGVLGKDTAPALAAYSWIDRSNVPVQGRTQTLLADLAAGVHATSPNLSIEQAVLAAAKDMVRKGVATGDLREWAANGGKFSRPGASEAFALGRVSTAATPQSDEALTALAAKVGREHTVSLFKRWAEGKAAMSRGDAKAKFGRTEEMLGAASAYVSEGDEKASGIIGDLLKLRKKGMLNEEEDRELRRIIKEAQAMGVYSRRGAKASFSGGNYYTVAAHIAGQPAGERNFQDLAEAKAYAKAMLDAQKSRANGKPVVVDVYPVVNYSPQDAVMTLKA